jgi:predicted GNAT family N-acyltransferase
MEKVAKTEFGRELGPLGLHAPIAPHDVRVGERIAARLAWKARGVTHSAEVRVWRLSPLAIELLAHGAAETLAVGTEVKLDLTVGNSTTCHPRLFVAQRRINRGQMLLGLRWYATDDFPVDGFACSADCSPTGIAPNPLHGQDFIFFRLKQVWRFGATLRTSLRNKLLLPGQTLDTVVSFAGLGEANLHGHVLHARVVLEGSRHVLEVKVQWSRPTPRALQTLTRYLQHFGPKLSPGDLKAAGLPVASILPSIDLGYARTEDEYRQVLALRQLAYEREGKLPPGKPAESTADSFDQRSRIVTARCRGEVVASLRLMFHERADAMEHEQYVTLPAHFPPRDQIIEVTRVCTHPDFRGSDLLFALFKHGLVISAQSGRRWMVGSATSKLLRIYTRLGFEPTELRYQHGALGGEEHTLFIGDLHGALLGKGINPILWNVLFSDVWDEVDPRQLPARDWPATMRLGLYRLMRPMALAVAARMKASSRRARR